MKYICWKFVKVNVLMSLIGLANLRKIKVHACTRIIHKGRLTWNFFEAAIPLFMAHFGRLFIYWWQPSSDLHVGEALSRRQPIQCRQFILVQSLAR